MFRVIKFGSQPTHS
jgi:hypothetical protein